MENINKITNTELIDTKEREELRGQIVMSYLAKMKNPFVTLSVLEDLMKAMYFLINKEKSGTHNIKNMIPRQVLVKQELKVLKQRKKQKNI